MFVYGFDDLLPIERDAVETLARIVGVEVTVSLTYEPQRAALSARAEVVQELRAFAGRVEQLPPLEEHYAPAARVALHHLERGLFEPAAERIDPGDAVGLLEAGGERAEAELVAGEVAAADPRRRPGRGDRRRRPLARPRRGAVRAACSRGTGSRSPATAAPRSPTPARPLGSGARAVRAARSSEASAADLLDVLRAPGRLERLELADALEAEVRREALSTADQARERLDWELGEIDSVRDADDPGAELAWQARRLFASPYRGRAAELDPAGRR